MSRIAATPESESAAPGTMFIPSDLPVELAEVLVGLLVEDCCVAAGAIYTSNDLGQFSGIYYEIWVANTVRRNLPKYQRRSVERTCLYQHIWHSAQQYQHFPAHQSAQVSSTGIQYIHQKLRHPHS